MRRQLLDRGFFGRPALEVARDLLGCVVVCGTGDQQVAVRLTEVEAYLGATDPGSHAFRGPTRRTEVMFGEPGLVYVYFSYGMHWCMNLVCGPVGVASAVLLRAGAIVEGIDLARSRRQTARSDRELARGPARLCQALGVTGVLNGTDATRDRSPITVHNAAAAPESVLVGPRTGVSGAGATMPLRFWDPEDPTVSPYRPAVVRRRG